MKNRVLNIAHRGFSEKYPENTLIAFERAILNSCDMIELDIHLSKDGELMVHHDYQLGRTANGEGLISDFSSHDLQKLDAGSWKNARFKTEKIPTLQEVFSLVQNDCLLNVEVKKETLLNQIDYDRMTGRLLELIHMNHLMESVVVSSFNWRVLSQLRRMSPDIQLGLLNHEPEKGLKLEDATDIQPYSYHPNFKNLEKNQVDLLHAYGLRVFPYTANGLDEYEKLFDMGVDGIITNDVEKLRHFIEFEEL